MAECTINEGPVTTWYGWIDDSTAGPLVGAAGVDVTKVPLNLSAGNVKFARWNVTAASTNTLTTGIGTTSLVSGTSTVSNMRGGRIVQVALAPDFSDPDASSQNGSGTYSLGGTITSLSIAYDTGVITFTTGGSRTFNVLVWYL